MTPERHTVDQRPGVVPEIRSDEAGVTFVMAPFKDHRLVIRCAPDGEVYVSIVPDVPAR